MANSSDFLEMAIPEAWRRRAASMASKRLTSEYKRDSRLNDHERLNKIVIGYLGEFAFAQYCHENLIPSVYLGRDVNNTPDEGDFKLCGNIIVDVKTQENQYLPKEDWRCEVTDEQLRRLPDSSLYVFAKLYKQNIIYIVGWVSKEKFLQNAKFRKKGDILVGKPVHYPKWDMTIAELDPMYELKLQF